MNYILTPQGITLSYDANFTTISEGDHRYKDILTAIKEGRLEDVPDLVDVSKTFSEVDGVDLVDGHIVIHGRRIPEVLTDKVLNFKKKSIPFEPLVEFSKKLLANPSFNSRQMLYKFLEHNGHPITKNGNFIAYKSVSSDFTDFHTGRFDNSVGNTVSMDRDEVDDNPNNTCSSGLHVAAYNYASCFGSGHLLEVEIDPKDVVSVPVDYEGEKMRVCAYTVKAICESRLDDVDLYEEEEYWDDEPCYEDEDCDGEDIPENYFDDGVFKIGDLFVYEEENHGTLRVAKIDKSGWLYPEIDDGICFFQTGYCTNDVKKVSNEN